MKKIFLIVITVLMSSWGIAQTCTQQLNQAEDDYAAGRLLRIPGQIEGCMNSFSKEEKIRAKKLLTLVYIFTDQEAKADVAMIALLKEDPEHRLDPTVDPAELFFLYDQFRTAPIFKLSLKLGGNSSNPKLIGSPYGTEHTQNAPVFINGKTDSGLKSYNYNNSDTVFSGQGGLGSGLSLELMAEKHFNHGIELGFGVQLRRSSYHVDQYLNNDVYSSSRTNQQTMLRTPLQIKYTYNYENRDKKILPYALIGTSFDYVLSAKYPNAVRDGGIGTTLSDLDLIAANQVNRYNYSFYGGLGASLRAKTHFVTLEVRYDMSRLNYINSKERYTNQDLTFELATVEPNLSLNFLSVSVGYTYSVHKPIKLR